MLVLPVLPYPTIDPVAFSIGWVTVRWYGLAYVVGTVLGWLYVDSVIANEQLWGGSPPLSRKDFDLFVVWITLAVAFGGRIGYVLFYDLPHYRTHPNQILNFSQGGMSFHGGFVASFLAVFFYAWWRRIPALSLSDLTVAGAPIGLGLAKIGNFINDELWGRPTNAPWAMIFPKAGPLPRHPSQLYEATLEGVGLFLILFVLVRFGALKRPGFVTAIFAVGYAAARVTCEFFREPDVQVGFLWGGLTMGMLLSIPVAVIGLVFLLIALTRKPTDKNLSEISSRAGRIENPL